MPGNLYGPGRPIASGAVMAEVLRALQVLVEHLIARGTPVDGSITDSKVAVLANIAQSKIAGLVARLDALDSTDASLVAGQAATAAAVVAEVLARGATDAAVATKADAVATAAGLATKADLVGGVIPTAQVPAIAISEYLGDVASQAAMLALVGQRGDWCTRSDAPVGAFMLTADDASVLGNWKRMPVPADAVLSVDGAAGVVVLAGDGPAGTATKRTLGLGATQAMPGNTPVQAPIAPGTFAGNPTPGTPRTAVVTTGPTQSIDGIVRVDDSAFLGSLSPGRIPFATGSGLPISNPTVEPVAVGEGVGVLNGTYKYKYTENDQSGETLASPEVTVTVVNQKVRLTLPLTRLGMITRHIYRTSAGGNDFKELGHMGGANGYFQPYYIDNMADGARQNNGPPVVNGTRYYNLSVGDLPTFRLNPDNSYHADDVAFLTKNLTVAGAYAIDCYGTIVVREKADPAYTAFKIGQVGDIVALYSVPTLDYAQAEPASTKVWHVGWAGNLMVRPIVDGTSLLVSPVTPPMGGNNVALLSAPVGTTGRVLYLEQLGTGAVISSNKGWAVANDGTMTLTPAVGSAVAGLSITHAGTGSPLSLVLTGGGANPCLAVQTNAGATGPGINIIQNGSGVLIATNKGWSVAAGGNMNLLGVTSPNYFRFLEMWATAASDRPLLVRGLSAGGQTANLAEFMPDPTAGPITFAVNQAGLPKWNHASSVQATVGAAGAASALPATPSKYLKVVGNDGVTYVVPAYAAA